MKRSVGFLGAVALAAVVSTSFLSVPARADTVYDWTISGGSAQDGSGALAGSGTITLSSTPTINGTGTGYAVDGITGMFTSTDITGAITGTFTSGAVDNLVYPSDPGGFILDDFGLGITVMVSPTNSYQLEFGAANGDPGFYNETCCGGGEPIYDYNDVTFGVNLRHRRQRPCLLLCLSLLAVLACSAHSLVARSERPRRHWRPPDQPKSQF